MEVNYRIGIGAKIALLPVAILGDLIGLLITFIGIGLFINTIITVLYALYSGFIFALVGVSIFSFKKARGWLISMGSELIPGLNAILPALTIGTLLVIRNTNQEDRLLASQNIKSEE